MTQPARSQTAQRATVIATGAVVAVLVSPLTVATASAQQMLSYAPSSPMQLQRGPVQLQGERFDRDSVGTVELPERLRRTEVTLETREAPGTVIIDTAATQLYYVLGGNRAIRYGVGVGREGFTWSGSERVTRKAEWPDWLPTAAMIARQPYLPRFMAGGAGNPLGARALYLGASQYRIHGTNDPQTIGKFVSSGCIRLTNADVEDLFSRVRVGAKVVVLPKSAGRQLEARTRVPPRPAGSGDVAALR